jgi:hypothetical protein
VNQFSSQSFWITPLHVSALSGGAGLSATVAIRVSLSFSVTVDSILSTADCSWSSCDSISISISPIFIFTFIGGFCGFSVKLSPIVYCIVQDVHAQHLNISTIPILAIGESW